ncbi:MAG: hypothetical protein LBQ76_10040, partial [Candidatus Fibromonas sp.]|nr:hypothetical protein [Candidatus Fibromonas sp.]
MAEEFAMKKSNKPQIDPFVASMLPESDKRTASFMGGGLIFALMLCFLTFLYDATVDELLFETLEGEDLSASMKIDEKKEDKKKEEKKTEKPRKKQGAGGKPRGKGQPNAPQSRGVLKMLTAKTSKSNFSAYNLMKDKNFAKDIDKVLKNVAGLQTSGKTELGGRRGSATGGFNDGYAEGGSGGIGDMLGGLMGGSAGGIGTKAKGSLKAPSARDIDMGSGDGSRSKAEIMAVVNARMPGLRNIYNKY